MPKKSISFKSGLSVFVILMLLSSIMIGCGDYRKFVLRDNVVNCSFEYPSSYTRTSVDQSTSDLITIYAAIFSGERKTAVVDSNLVINIINDDDSFPDYSAVLEYKLSIEKSGPRGFELIERSPTTVAGVQGEKVSYYYSRIRIEHNSGKEELIPSISYRAYFENSGLLWEIIIDAIIGRAEQAKADFEHILQTFQFLE